tara:strand:- start:184 stop:432 length:249 start_codon:yes stop_codon:yes gene_type:complete
MREKIEINVPGLPDLLDVYYEKYETGDTGFDDNIGEVMVKYKQGISDEFGDCKITMWSTYYCKPNSNLLYDVWGKPVGTFSK